MFIVIISKHLVKEMHVNLNLNCPAEHVLISLLKIEHCRSRSAGF